MNSDLFLEVVSSFDLFEVYTRGHGQHSLCIVVAVDSVQLMECLLICSWLTNDDCKHNGVRFYLHSLTVLIRQP